MPSAAAYPPRPTVIKWLLDSDPAIQWQVLRDLTDAPPAAVAAARSGIATEGWGAQLLAGQSRGGYWGPPQPQHGWLYSIWTLTLLKDLGLDPASASARRMIRRVKRRLTFRALGNRPLLHGETEPCINGRLLGLGAYFDEPHPPLAGQLLSEQLPDGGWNCEAPQSRRSSFHTTICVLEGLLDYERAAGKTAALTKSRRRGEEYLLERSLFRGLRSGDVIDKRWLRFAYPPIWHYDILRALDYFRSTGRRPDPRVAEAIDVVIARRHQNSRWPLNLIHPERLPIEMETDTGRASRWNTLRALRVLRWYAAA